MAIEWDSSSQKDAAKIRNYLSQKPGSVNEEVVIKGGLIRSFFERGKGPLVIRVADLLEKGEWWNCESFDDFDFLALIKEVKDFEFDGSLTIKDQSKTWFWNAEDHNRFTVEVTFSPKENVMIFSSIWIPDDFPVFNEDGEMLDLEKIAEEPA